MSDSSEFARILEKEAGSELDTRQREDLVRFREAVIAENGVQNLTRLLSPRDFYEGHVVDVLELRKSKFLGPSALDLGAGMGVPGLLSALLFRGEGETRWISCDSEGKKADFTGRMAREFEVEGFHSYSERVEKVLATRSVHSVVARAVGPVSRLYTWIASCSTWNSLVLLKGPKWEEEWKAFQKTAQRKRLVLRSEVRYTVGLEKKSRIIVALDRA